MVTAIPLILVVLDTTKVQIFKQITTGIDAEGQYGKLFQIPQRYRFSSKSQRTSTNERDVSVVLDTTKGQIFKQITTGIRNNHCSIWLFQIPQRYRFSSKSQRSFVTDIKLDGCFRYHKGTDFQANHNNLKVTRLLIVVVLDTTKVQIFKQITTTSGFHTCH